MFCAYCGVDHDGNVRFTNEHVVPYAIGGSDAFTIRVCEKSNNDLGGLVDKPLIETFVLWSQRFFLGLRGTDGTKPTLDLSGKTLINGEQRKVTYLIHKDRKELKISPAVTKTPTADGEQWSVSGDPADVRRILEGKMKSVLAKGKQVKDADGNVLGLDDLEPLIAASPVKTFTPDIVKTLHVSHLDFARFFAKLALATGHYVYGELFSRSVHAELLRKAMHARDVLEAIIPGAHIWPAESPEAKKVLAPFQKENSHTLGILSMEPHVFVASLFGDIDAIIPLGELGTARVLSRLSGRVFQIALPSREFHDRTTEEYLSLLLAERRA